MSIEVILVGIDESPGSQAAAAWAAELAVQLGARIVAVHAFEPLDHLDDIGPGTDFVDVRDDITGQMEETWCHAFRDSDVPCQIRIEEGRPAEVLIGAAREVEADLIVVGARRMGTVEALTMGSTSDQVIREALRPVVVIHPPEV
jgi:nucleotide-binding universal stress UspA family protein